MTLQLAETAARLVSEGQPDYDKAIQKAAQIHGCHGHRGLPTIQDVISALKVRTALYSNDTSPHNQRAFLTAAAKAMHWFDQQGWSVWLTGPALSGIAPPETPITLELDGVETKLLELKWLNEGRDFKLLTANVGQRDPVCYRITLQDQDIELRVFDNSTQRRSLFPRGHLHHQRASLAEVEALLAQQ